jgi:uncharacterized protein DUF4252
MNARIVLCLVTLLFAGPLLAQAKGPPPRGQLLLPEMAGLADKASESVTVTLDSQLLGFAARFLNPDVPDEAAAKKIVSSLTGIYVRKFTFDTDYAYPKADIDGIRRQLSAPGWSRIVEARSKKEQTDVDVYLLTDGGKARGLAIIASEPREFAIVNIVGSVNLEDLHELEGKFGVPDLQIESGKKSAAPAPAFAPGARPAPKATSKPGA